MTTVRDTLRKTAVDTLYAARDSGKMMDGAAEAVLDAILGSPAVVLAALIEAGAVRQAGWADRRLGQHDEGRHGLCADDNCQNRPWPCTPVYIATRAAPDAPGGG